MSVTLAILISMATEYYLPVGAGAGAMLALLYAFQRTGFGRVLLNGNSFVKREEMELKLKHQEERFDGSLKLIRQMMEVSAEARTEMRSDMKDVKEQVGHLHGALGELKGQLGSMAGALERMARK